MLKFITTIFLLCFGACAFAQAPLEAILDAADKYLTGNGVERDPETAIGIALEGVKRYPYDPRGYEYLGNTYSSLAYDQYDLNKAITFYAHAANELDSEKAKLELCRLFIGSGDHALAAQTIRKYKDKSSAEYNYLVGTLYLDGIAYTKDLNLAKHHFRLASQKGHQPSINALAGIDSLNEVVQSSSLDTNINSPEPRSNDCRLTGNNNALYAYCHSGSCNGFSDNYKLWHLCENSSANGYSGNTGVWQYLENAHTGFFSGNALSGAISCADSFAKRKEFIIYWSQGFVRRCR